MGPTRQIKARHASGNCCEDCRCGGNGCPGCPEVTTQFHAVGATDITKSPWLMKRYTTGRPRHFKGVRKRPPGIPPKGRMAMGDFDINACLEGGASLDVCQGFAAQDAASNNPRLTTVNAAGAPAPAASSGGGFGAAIGAGLSALLRPSQPAMMPLYPQTGMSTTTMVVLAGGAAVLLVMLARRN